MFTAINILYVNMISLSFERIPELKSSRKRGLSSGPFERTGLNAGNKIWSD